MGCAEAATKLLSTIPVATPVIQEVFNDKIPKGFVIDTEPASGSQVKRGAGIKIIVSKGIEQIALINFVNKSVTVGQMTFPISEFVKVMA